MANLDEIRRGFFNRYIQCRCGESFAWYKRWNGLAWVDSFVYYDDVYSEHYGKEVFNCPKCGADIIEVFEEWKNDEAKA